MPPWPGPKTITAHNSIAISPNIRLTNVITTISTKQIKCLICDQTQYNKIYSLKRQLDPSHFCLPHVLYNCSQLTNTEK